MTRPFYPEVPNDAFAPEEISQLERYGAWLNALATGVISPETPEQAHFVSVARGRDQARTPFERLWMKYRAASNDGTWKRVRVRRRATCVACGEMIRGGDAALREVRFRALKHVTCPRANYFASGRQARSGAAELIFHRRDCDWSDHLDWKDRISFTTREEAVVFGCRPCKHCRP